MDQLHNFIQNILNDKYNDLTEIIIDQILKEVTYVVYGHISEENPIDPSIHPDEIFKKVAETLRSKKDSKNGNNT